MCDSSHGGSLYCNWCAEPMSPAITQVGEVLDMHPECKIRSFIGGVNHLQRLCACFGGHLPSDPPGMTTREAALAAVAYWKAQRGR